MPLWFYDLVVYCLQVAILILAGGAMLAATRLSVPRVRLVYLQVLLTAALLLPLVEPWRAVPMAGRNAAQNGTALWQPGSLRLAAGGAGTPHAFPLSLYQLVAVLAVAGFLFRLVRLSTGLVRLHRARQGTRPLGPRSLVEELGAALGVRPHILVSDRIPSPVTFGWRIPCVLLPARFEQMNAASQRAILCHEFLHVRRGDCLRQTVEEILRAMFWFHPAVSWVVAETRLAREQTVDGEVVTLTGSRRDYLNALLEIAVAGPHSIPAPFFLSERHLKRRVKLIVREASMPTKRIALAISASVGALLLSGALAGALLPLQTPAATQRQTKRDHDSHLAAWANGPVRYIMVPQERTRYEKLTTNRQRAAFIKRFWNRRNPNPGSATNAYKNEFYRRVAYANEHFGSSGPGWKSDRGHVYIAWGPPDEISSKKYRKGPYTSYAYQIWTYQHLPGIGKKSVTFVDRTGKGDYQLVPGSFARPRSLKHRKNPADSI